MARGLICGVAGEEPTPVLSRLAPALGNAETPTWVEVVSEDPTGTFATLLSDLQHRPSPSGDGKRITSGYAYKGVEPVLAWANACRDRLYPVMRHSIESFERRWSEVRPSLGSQRFHHVSLGPGDGQKDAVILRDLRGDHPGLCYIPVDSSTEMLRLAISDLAAAVKLPGARVVAVPCDISAPSRLAALRQLIGAVVEDTPVLFSLLGNTLASFDDDVTVLRELTTQLLRPQDRLLLEVAATPALDADLAGSAAGEYERSRTFGEFVTSALRRYTNLHVDLDSVEYRGSVESARALMIKMMYRNDTADEVQVTLPYGGQVRFPPGDTIRLLLSRKYTGPGLEAMLAASRLTTVRRQYTQCPELPGGARFGIDLRVLSTHPPGDAGPTRADEVWSRVR